MNNFVKLAVPASLAVLLAACGQSGTSSMPGMQNTQSQAHQTQSQSHVNLPDGITLSRHVMGTVGGSKVLPDLANMTYGGGAVMHTPKIYVMYWGLKGAGDPNGLRKIENAYLAGVGGSNWLSTVTQYYDSKNGKIDNPAGQYSYKGKTKQFLNDNVSVPVNPTDSQYQAEARKLVDKFGANPNAAYIVQSSYGHNISGFGSSYCAYHGAFTYKSTVISYTVEPYIPEAGAACGANFVNKGAAGTDDGVTIVVGHELAESQTDPGANYSGWGGQGGEIGDYCAWVSTTSNQPFSTGTFPVQPLWSNQVSGCTLTGPAGP